jgi:nucleoredoxin
MQALGLPAQLLDAHNKLVPTSSLDGYVFGLYFSAHWCPPCRGFTPELAKWYKNFQDKHPDRKLAIIFISSDRDESDFNEYRKEMNFHALPFSEREVKGALSTKFGVRGIPTLIFFDATGKVTTKEGRAVVSSDPNGNDYPWDN